MEEEVHYGRSSNVACRPTRPAPIPRLRGLIGEGDEGGGRDDGTR